MIESVFLLATLKDTSRSNEISKGLELWPPKKKAIKLSPDFNIKEFYFSVRTTKRLIQPKIIINEFESLDLSVFNDDESGLEYRSDRYGSQTFLGFNLGIMELYLTTSLEAYPLATLNNKDNKFTNENLTYMYESVATSLLFELFVPHYTRANIGASKAIENPSKYFWLTISNANSLIKEANRFINGDLNFTNKISTSSLVSRYNSRAILHENDIEWLLDNPSELTPSDQGIVELYGLKYQIENISQSSLKSDFDTYENRLLVSTLYSVRSTLNQLLDEYKDTKLFPHKSVNEIVNKVDESLSYIDGLLKISPPYNTHPEFSNKYLDDVRYVKLFELICNWYTNSKLSLGNEIRSSVMGITEIFEHFCLIKIIDTFKNEGFIQEKVEYRNSYEAEYIFLKRGTEEISVYYEPTIRIDSIHPLITSKLTSHYRPDFTLVYKDEEITRYGVIDAKFSDADGIKKLSDDIYAKYAIYLHRPDNNQSIDYVWAMYPSDNEKSIVNYSRNERYRDHITPSLGYFSVPLEENCSDKIKDFLIELVTNKKIVANTFH
jgi:hypothetical protein